MKRKLKNAGRQIVSDAQKEGEKIHIGRIFEILSIKGDELQRGTRDESIRGEPGEHGPRQ